MPSGASEELHYHSNAQQLFYILSGKANFELNGRREIICANESIHVPPKHLHKISNNENEDLRFLVISQPMAQSDRVDVINHTEELKEAVKTLNVEWLEKYFKVEPMDVIQLSDPQTEIIDKGGMIYYARHNDKIVGTVSLLKVETGIYELGKMAVTQTAQRIGIGTILMEHCINIAKQKKLSKLILYSNTQLKSAIHLYKKYGFVEIALESGHYDRANIKMEKII